MNHIYRKRIKTILLLSAIFCCFAQAGLSQNAIQFDQYMYNKLQYNPAYAGCSQGLSGTLLHSSQWVGIEGAPQTQILILQSPVHLRSIGWGLSVVHQSIGVKSQSSFSADYSYALRVGSGQLAMGVSLSAILLDEDFSKLTTAQFGDNYFTDDFRKFMFNAGAGLFYYTHKFYAGISSPQLIFNEVSYSENKANYIFNPLKNPYYFVSGYVFEVNDFKFKPSVMLKHHLGTPPVADLNFNTLYNNKVGVGLLYRHNNAVGMMAEYYFAERYRISYAFNASTKALRTYNAGTHEIMFGFTLPHERISYQSPRYF